MEGGTLLLLPETLFLAFLNLLLIFVLIFFDTLLSSWTYCCWLRSSVIMNMYPRPRTSHTTVNALYYPIRYCKMS